MVQMSTFKLTTGAVAGRVLTAADGEGVGTWELTQNDGDWIISGIDMSSGVTGKVGIGTSSPTAKLDVNGSTGYNQIRMRTSYTPTGSDDTNGYVGDVAWDDNYIYVKTSTEWKRAALSTW
jgi:hypothetical protein